MFRNRFLAYLVSWGVVFAATVPIWAQIKWNPFREEQSLKSRPGKRAYVRGSQQEIGEVCFISGGKAWLERVGKEGEKIRIQLRVGDDIIIGSIIETEQDKVVKILQKGQLRLSPGDSLKTTGGTVLEILLSYNARLRLGPGTRLKMAEKTVSEKNNVAITSRKIILERGSLRARVRQNRLTPSPVLIISMGAEMSVGLPELNVQGGVDILVNYVDNRKEALVQVFNGGIALARINRRLHRKERFEMKRGQSLLVPGRDQELPPIANLAEGDLLKSREQFAFSTEARGLKFATPVPLDKELDGP